MKKKPLLDEYGKEIPGFFVRDRSASRIKNDGWLSTTFLNVFVLLISVCILSLMSLGTSYLLNTIFDTEIFTFWRTLILIVLVRFVVYLK